MRLDDRHSLTSVRFALGSHIVWVQDCVEAFLQALLADECKSLRSLDVSNKSEPQTCPLACRYKTSPGDSGHFQNHILSAAVFSQPQLRGPRPRFVTSTVFNPEPIFITPSWCCWTAQTG